MIKSIKTIESLAGCGKTYRIREICSQLKNEDILYITFNREVMEATRKQLSNTNVLVHTIHSLMYQEIQYLNLLPEELLDFDSNIEIKSKAFKELENIFLDQYEDKGRFHLIQNVKTIFVDEYQNVSSTLIKVVKILCKHLDVDLYLVVLAKKNYTLVGFFWFCGFIKAMQIFS